MGRAGLYQDQERQCWLELSVCGHDNDKHCMEAFAVVQLLSHI